MAEENVSSAETKHRDIVFSWNESDDLFERVLNVRDLGNIGRFAVFGLLY